MRFHYKRLCECETFFPYIPSVMLKCTQSFYLERGICVKKKWILSMFLLLFLAIGVACNGDDEGNEQAAEETNEEQTELPEPTLDDIPNVVAEVNGEEIPKEDFEPAYVSQFQQMSMQAQMTGEEVDEEWLKEQTINSIIGTTLLVQESNARNYEASEEQVNDTLTELVDQYGFESEEELFSAFEEQGMSEEEVRDILQTEVKVDQLIQEEAGDTTPSEEEMQKAYDEMVAMQKQLSGDEEEIDIPSFEEMKSDIEQQLIFEKEREATNQLIEQLREKADITIYL